MTTAAAAAAGDLSVLDALKAAEDLWVERTEDARRMVEHLRRADFPITVLHGPVGSGKSELVRRWVVPMLEAAGERVTYGKSCDPPVPAAGAEEGRTFDFRDSFHHCLTDAHQGGDVLQWLRVVAATRGRSRLVLVIPDDALSTIFQLGAAVPHLLDDIHEIPPLSDRFVVEALRRALSRVSVSVTPAVLDALAEDFSVTSLHTPPSTELVACVAFEFGRSAGATELGLEDYQSRGRLIGVLERHLEYLFEQLPADLDAQLAWAILSEAGTKGKVEESHLEDIAVRFDADIDATTRVVRWLEGPRAVLRRSADGPDYQVVPLQLAIAAAARMRREGTTADRSSAILRAGVKQFKETEALLSDHHFRKVHADRSALHVSDDEAKLMLRCALLYESAAAGAASHWLRRIKDPRVRAEVLLDALFDARADIRERAAAELRGFPFPEVRSQLHLVALRDDSDGVRASAIDSLAAMRDEALLTSLVKEVRDRHSPYRLRAMETLRIFDEPAATEALVRVISTNTAGDDAEGRRLAVHVLGQQNTMRSAEALLDISLNDPDSDDREWAGGALSALTNAETVGALLERVRQPEVWRDTPIEPQVVGIPATIAAAGVVAAGWLVHPLPLLTLKRWRAAALVAVGEIAVVALANPRGPWPNVAFLEGMNVLFFLLSAAIGMLVPLKILMGERLDRQPQGAYRRGLGRVLFIVNAPTTFLCLHGMPAMLARQWRAAIALFALQAIDLAVLFMFWYVWSDDSFGVYLRASESVLVRSFATVGILLYVCVWVLGLFCGLSPAFIFRRRALRRRRSAGVYAALLRNPVAARMLVEPVARGAGRERWRKWVLRSFGPCLDGALRECWDETEPDGRRHLFRAVARRRDAAAVEFLKKRANTLGWPERMRYWWASLAYALSLWPRPLRAAVAIVVYVLFAMTATLIELYLNAPENLQRRIQRQETSDDDRLAALRTLLRIADTGDHAAAVHVAASLGKVIEENYGGFTDRVRSELLATAVTVARRSGEHGELAEAVWHVRTENPTGAIETLKAMGSPEAADKLGEFVAEPPSGIGGPKDDPKIAQERTSKEKLLAIDALRELAAGNPAAVEILHTLGQNKTLPPQVYTAAQEAAAGADPITTAASKISTGDFAGAVETIKAALPHLEGDRRTMALGMASTAYGRRAQVGYEAGDFDDARENFFAAIDTGPLPDDIQALVTLGLALAYHFHEVRAVANPESASEFETVHAILSRLMKLPLNEESRLAVQVNLAEASLTTGRFDDAHQLAQSLLGAQDPSTVLNMHFLRFAALTCAGSPRAAEAARRELDAFRRNLKPDFTNTWVYAGTRHFIRTSQMPEARKQVLLSTLDQIDMSR